MQQSILQSIEAEISRATDRNGKIDSCTALGGGCINDVFKVTLDDSRKYCVKTNDASLLTMFWCESDGLQALAGCSAIQVPKVVGEPGSDKSRSYLILDWIESGRPPGNFQELFGRQLAELHLQSRKPSAEQAHGFHRDNFLGSAIQPNLESTDWIEFFGEQRLRHQLRWAKDQGHSGKLQKQGESLLAKLDQFLLDDEYSSLIHGDLWSGNYLCNENGQPVLIDPAVYFANREAEFGMITLFGSVDAAFYRAYEEVYPFQDGYSERFEIYKLYHVLNHLNLFGSSYLSQCLSILKKFA